jgi:hypothetical protein
VEFELKVDFGQVNSMRHEDDALAPHTVTSRDLKLNNNSATPAHFLSQEEQDESQAGGIAIVKIGPGQRLKLMPSMSSSGTVTPPLWNIPFFCFLNTYSIQTSEVQCTMYSE